MALPLTGPGASPSLPRWVGLPPQCALVGGDWVAGGGAGEELWGGPVSVSSLPDPGSGMCVHSQMRKWGHGGGGRG